MKQIKAMLIHWLGGHTEKETQDEFFNGFVLGQNNSFRDIKKFADSLYGLPVDEWCKKMYEHLGRTLKNNEASNGTKTYLH